MKEALILAGGLGTRLRSMVSELPKCMAPVAGKPFLEHLFVFLRRNSFDRVVLSVGYLRESIFDWVEKTRSQWPFEIDFAVEETPLGTGGGIRLGLSKCVCRNVFVLNGDTFFDVDFELLMDSHCQASLPITLALKPMQDFDRYGSVDIDDSGLVLAFNEKCHVDNGLINGGVYIIDRESAIFDGLPEKFSFETAVLEPQCSLRRLNGVVNDGYFIDIGIPEDYIKADAHFRS